MYNGMQIYRAVVTASSSTTGSLYVSIPSVLGTSTSIAVSAIGRAAVSGVWVVPDVGEQVLVAVEDDKFSNVFLLYPVDTSIAPGSITSTEIATGAITSTEIATGAITSTEIATGAVAETAIATGAVTVDKLGLVEAKLECTGQTVSNSAIVWDVAGTDVHGFCNFTSSITVPTGLRGLYNLGCYIQHSGTASASIYTAIYVNGTSAVKTAAEAITGAAPERYIGSCFFLEAGDTLKVYFYAGSGSRDISATLWLTRIMD